VASLLEGGTCISYGARALNEGGYQSIPKLSFPGGALLGCSAGFLNVAKIKGSHTAMKSGMLAAEAAAASLAAADGPLMLAGEDDGEAAVNYGAELTAYEPALRASWINEELYAVRNIHPSFSKFGGLFGFAIYSAIDSFLLRGRAPWTFTHGDGKSDAERTKPAAECKEIEYPTPDGELSFDILTNLQRSGTYHEDNQPAHLRVKPELADVPVGGASALVTFIRLRCTLRTQISRSICTFTHTHTTGQPFVSNVRGA
jgi:electron-transferring-flavoprotein dehydrogenase